MNTTKILIAVTVCTTAILLGIIISLPLTGCDGVPCCPYIIKFYAKPDVVCPIGCFDNAGQTYLYATVAYHKDENPCTPSSGPNIDIINTGTNNKLTSASWNQSQAGIYESTIIVKNLNTDTEFELDAYGENGCPAATKKTQNIIVLPQKDPHPYQLCTSHGDLIQKCKWLLTYDNFGKGIVIDKIENPSRKYTVTVEDKGLNAKTTLAPGAVANYPFTDQTPNTSWTLEIATTECDDFLKESKDFCINLWVKCQCVK